MNARFHDRRHAGRILARKLQPLIRGGNVLVLALPRGGVVVGYEVARAIGAPLDVLIVRKLGVPGQEELGFGAIASDGIRVINHDVVGQLGIRDDVIERVTRRERVELQRREQLYRGGRPPADVRDRTVILVDDGLATGATMLSAVEAMRAAGASSLTVAVPVAAVEAEAAVRRTVETCITVLTPIPFFGVGAYYDDFAQTDDAEVANLLAAARLERHQSAPDAHAAREMR